MGGKSSVSFVNFYGRPRTESTFVGKLQFSKQAKGKGGRTAMGSNPVCELLVVKA